MSVEVKGLATCLAIDCETKEGKKLCKKLKVSTSNFVLKHYKDGEFHKDYDRAISVKSMVTFLKVNWSANFVPRCITSPSRTH